MTPWRSPSRRRSEAVDGGRAGRLVGAAALNDGYLAPGRAGGIGQELPPMTVSFLVRQSPTRNRNGTRPSRRRRRHPRGCKNVHACARASNTAAEGAWPQGSAWAGSRYRHRHELGVRRHRSMQLWLRMPLNLRFAANVLLGTGVSSIARVRTMRHALRTCTRHHRRS